MNQTPYSKTRNNITLLIFALGFLILAMVLNGCATQRSPCPMRTGYIGYGAR